MLDFDFSILQCPITGEGLLYRNQNETKALLATISETRHEFEGFSEGFINESSDYFYPVINEVILLLSRYALFLGSGEDKRGNMVFDKERVFKYYNEISYGSKNNLKIYEDSPKWVDYRDVSAEYIGNAFTRAGNYIKPSGKYLLDIASGPIGLKEYLDLSENYEIRICADISLNALLEARNNYSHRRGIYLCADITNIPLQENVCDSVLSQHTLYHIPAREQKTAVIEMYRVCKPGGRLAIVYNWFYYSWLMNISLFPVQIYRILRHIAGKAYVRLVKSKPRLYFFIHSPSWFRRSFSFGKRIEFFCWRTTNIYFMKIYIHKWLGGKQFLKWLRKSEDKHPKFWGRFGDYPVIVVTKE